MLWFAVPERQHDIHSSADPAKSRVPAREMRRVRQHDVELRTVCVGPRVRHPNNPRVERDLREFIRQAVAGPPAPGTRRIATLSDEPGKHPMERCTVKESFTRQKDEAIHARGSHVHQQVDREIAPLGVHHRLVLPIRFRDLLRRGFVLIRQTRLHPR